MKQTLTKTIFFFLLLSGSMMLSAQTGSVSGVVTDLTEGTTLPGANVYIKGQETTGTITDIDGRFTLSGIDPGDVTVVVSFLGFTPQEFPLNIVAGEDIELNVEMSADAVMGKEVLVTAQALGQAKAINQQLNAESISNIVAADRIQELPDVNAAEAIARLPGVSINRSGGEGQKIVVRGLEPKFNAITVNGVRMPANDANDRSVDLSLISPEMLEGIELFKAPLPYMDAEAIGGTVNLKLKKAPKEFRFLAKLLGGYNDLNNYWGDYKGVVQASQRFIDDKLGVVIQGSTERFNRGGDVVNYAWSQGATDANTGVTAILGNNLNLEDRAELRRRDNVSMSLDYDLGSNHVLTLFGLYSETNRDRFSTRESYRPGTPEIDYRTRGIENKLALTTASLAGEHPFGFVNVDWNLSTSQSRGTTPYDFAMGFRTVSSPFSADVVQGAHPETYYDFATHNLQETALHGSELFDTRTNEQSITAALNFEVPIKLGDKIGGYFKFGGKYFTVDRDRDVSQFNENFYYLGGAFTSNAAEVYGAERLTYLEANRALISMLSFSDDRKLDFEGEEGTNYEMFSSLDPDLAREWYDAQKDLLSNNRAAEDDRYTLTERIRAGYAMLRLNFGDMLTVIPGFRVEQSDNDYTASISTVSGRYGVNGFFFDTTTFQKYTEFLPHLHMKFQPFEWFDIRASYSNTLARPDYRWIVPSAEINNTSTNINAGNPNLRHARATNYDLFFTAYKGGLGLLSFGLFYKEIDDIFYPQDVQLVDPEFAAGRGWPAFSGYQLSSFINADQTTVRGYEIDLQTNLGFLPSPFNGIVINANYSRLYSETQVFFLTSETKLIRPFPPVFETIYTSNERLVSMPSQPPHIFNLSFGYDIGNFSARVSTIFQGSKARSYSVNDDFDSFDLEFWRWDASLKQTFADHWSFFLNLNNFNNQQDISFIRSERFLNNIETFGFTATAGFQYRL